MANFIARMAFALAILLMASAAFIGASIFLCVAVFLFLTHVVPPPFAALLTALFLIIFAVIALVIARMLLPSGRLARSAAGAAPAELLEALLGAELAGAASKSPFATTGIAFLVGILLGISPRLRRAAADIIRG
jgi:hypothetical protein